MRVIPNKSEETEVVEKKECTEIRINNTALDTEKLYYTAEEKVKQTPDKNTLSDTLKSINENRRKGTLSEKMTSLLLTQLQAELSNYTLYNTFALYFHRKGLLKLYEYWEGRADEELNHHKWIAHYLAACDAEFQYPEVPAVKVDIKDNLSPFKDTVDREIETTGGINILVRQAISEGDWATFKFLMGESEIEGMLVKEQIEEEKLSRDVLKLAESSEDWLAIQESIYSYYFRNEK